MLSLMSHRYRYFIATVIVAALGPFFAADPLHAQATSSELLVHLGPNAVGRVDSVVERTDTGWAISGGGRLNAPIDLTTKRILVTYDPSWQPRELQIDATAQGGVFTVRTMFSGTQATNVITKVTDHSNKVDTVSRDAIVLPNLFFQAYEALAMRLSALEAETSTVPVYIAPQAEIQLQVKRLTPETIDTGDAPIRARRFALTFMNPGGPIEAELWADDGGRLLRFAVQQLTVTRSDIARVSARVETVTRAGDQTIQIPANGFTIVGTLSEPSGTPPSNGRFPALVLVPGSGATDRDETVGGIPIFGQLAGGFADAGFMVVRYDKRGVGQSGGRAESATLDDYAEDARAVVRTIARRKDVDPNRIAVLGHGDGAWVALLAATREEQIDAVVVAAGASGRGADLILERQASLLGSMTLSDPERQSRIDLQKRIQAAVMGQGEWTDVPAKVREQADTPWFRSFLAFDPATVIARVRQPLLIVHGELDRYVPVQHADRLAELARARRKTSPERTEVVKLPKLNHLLVEAETGHVSEYPTLSARAVNPEVAKTVVDWLSRMLPPAK
jgi:pimeloyl-ACP methyl ester carboxylesterase